MSSRLITAAVTCRFSSGILKTMHSPKFVSVSKQVSLACSFPNEPNAARLILDPSKAVSFNLLITFKFGNENICKIHVNWNSSPL